MVLKNQKETGLNDICNECEIILLIDKNMQLLKSK